MRGAWRQCSGGEDGGAASVDRDDRSGDAVLDRAGFGPTASLRVDDQASDLSSLSSAELKERAMDIVKRAAAAEEEEQPVH